MGDKRVHKREDLRVVGGGCQHQLAESEGVADCPGHITPCQIVHHDFGASVGGQFFCQLGNRLLRIAVHGGVGNHDSLFLRLIGGPGVIQIQIVSQILRQNGAVERANDLDIQPGRLLEQRLYLGTVLAHDTDEIPAGFIRPGLLRIGGAEFAESVGGEQHLIRGIVGNDDLRPMDHGCGYKRQGMLAQIQRISFSHHDAAIREIGSKEILHHSKGFGGGYNFRLRIGLGKIQNVGRVIRLHMLDDQIIRHSCAQGVLDIIQPLVGESAVYGIHDGDFFIQDRIGVIGDAIRHFILSFKQIDFPVADSDIADVTCDIHCLLLHVILF